MYTSLGTAELYPTRRLVRLVILTDFESRNSVGEEVKREMGNSLARVEIE